MKHYPSIERSTGQSFQEFDAYVFDKLDGNNVRVEWAKKSGWYKFGSRTRLFDRTDPLMGGAIDIFNDKLSEPLAKLAVDNRWERLIVFCEYWGPKSLGGQHEPGDEMRVSLFDIAPYKQGIVGPARYLKLVGDLDIDKAGFLGHHRWTRGYVAHIREMGHLTPAITCEGVVGKSGDGHHLVMAKAKTQAWIDRIMARYGEEQGKKIVES